MKPGSYIGFQPIKHRALKASRQVSRFIARLIAERAKCRMDDVLFGWTRTKNSTSMSVSLLRPRHCRKSLLMGRNKGLHGHRWFSSHSLNDSIGPPKNSVLTIHSHSTHMLHAQHCYPE